MDGNTPNDRPASPDQEDRVTDDREGRSDSQGAHDAPEQDRKSSGRPQGGDNRESGNDQKGGRAQTDGQSRDSRTPRPNRRRNQRQQRRRRGSSQQRDQPDRGDQLDQGDQPESSDRVSEPLGVLEVLGSGSGFIRRPESGFTPSKDDIYVGAKVIHKFGLRTGDELSGSVGRRPKNGKSPPLTHLDLVNTAPPEDARRRPDFDRLSAVHPSEQLVLACGRAIGGEPDYTNRVIDLFCPLGKGQRAMIVAPSKAGKTTVLQSVAEGIVTNNPECRLMIFLVDERPEEITDMEMCGFGEVIASSFDRPAERHCQMAEMTLERARRYVESGQEVVIILDSITRLARAYNTVEQGSGRTLSGGLDANSLEKPKRFIGSARKIDPKQGGGSLTIVATALVDTGSRMDQVIFEEFKGTGNSELVLSREVADKRIFPAIDLNASSTRKEELLLDPATLSVSRAMRRQLADVPPTDAMNELLGVMQRTKNNEGLVAMASQKI